MSYVGYRGIAQVKIITLNDRPEQTEIQIDTTDGA
jgi:hypothetical protein